MSASNALRHSRGAVSRRLTAALLCVLLLLTSLSFLGGADVFAAGTRVFSCVREDADGNRYQVQVRCRSDAEIPTDAVLQVEELTEDSADYDAYLTRTEEALSVDMAAADSVRFFDISLVSHDSPAVQYQPAEGATVEVRVQMEDEPQNDLSVIHFAEEAPPEVLESTTEGSTVSFETTGFSVYAIVDAPGSAECTEYGILETDPTQLAGNGFYLAAETASTPVHTYFMKSGIVSSGQGPVIDRTAVNSSAGAVKYYFEAVQGTNNQYRLYYLNDNDEPQYVKLTNNTSAQFVSNAANATVITATRCEELGSDYTNRFFLSFAGTNGTTYYLNLRKDDNGKGFNGSDYGPPAKPSKGSGIYLYKVLDPDDPAGLDGKTTALVQQLNDISGITNPTELNRVNELMPTVADDGVLALREHYLRSNPLNQDETVTVDGTVMKQWTFHCVGGSVYYLTTYVDGVLKYLRMDTNGDVTLADSYDEYCDFTYQSGTGENAGCCSFKFKKANKALGYYSKNKSDIIGFRAALNSKNQWFRFAQPSTLQDDDTIEYTATKVSVSDLTNVYNGQQVVVYARIWDDDEKIYKFYAIDHDGSLVYLYDEGDTVRWQGSQVDRLLWNFTEYYYQGTTNPNYYYELQNNYSGKYIAPQVQNGQILSDNTIGLNLNGRRWEKYSTSIIAWDDPHYDYVGLKVVEGESGLTLVPALLAEADEFRFAVLKPVDHQLTPVETVDNNEHGIHMRMVKFPGATDEGRNVLQTTVIGENQVGIAQNRLAFARPDLVSTDLNAEGYPTATITGTSLEELFGNATDANHLFYESVYKSSGYFEYKSTQSFAHLGNDGDFDVYDELGTIETSTRSQGHGQFMPYNTISTDLVSEYNNVKDVYNNPLPLDHPRLYEELYSIPRKEANYYFGMEMEASFVQSPDGLDEWGHDIIFEFAGDDDMWLYVDGERILDLGGIHSALVGKINFRTGEVTFPVELDRNTDDGINVSDEEFKEKATDNAANLQTTTLRALMEQNYRGRNPEATNAEVEAYLDDIFKPGTSVFKDYSSHTMKMFYMERGAGASNLHLRFNLNTMSAGQLLLTKEVSGTDKQNYTDTKFPFQIYYYDRDYDIYRTVSYGTDPETGEPKYFGANSVSDDATESPLEYMAVYTDPESGLTYNDVFFLRPGQTADIRFPNEEVVYYVKECDIDTTVYDEVLANGNPLSSEATTAVNYEDYSTYPEVIGKRKIVKFNNHVDKDALHTLQITKKLFDAQGNPLTAADDPTGFRFRVYIGDPLDYYRLDHYYVKDPQGNYCYYDSNAAAFASTGCSVFEDLTTAQLATVTFTTSPSGAIDKIPADYTVEIRNLMTDTPFYIEERASDIPYGYSLIDYIHENGTHVSQQSATPMQDVIYEDAEPHITVNNKCGWGLTVKKVWSDNTYMYSHDNIYFAVYYDDGTTLTLVPNTLRQMRTAVDAQHPTAETSLYYYFDALPLGGTFADYTIREVVPENPTVDANGYVTAYTNLTVLEAGDPITVDGIVTAESQGVPYTYHVAYQPGVPIGVVNNIRTDTATNTRNGIRIVKTDRAGNPLAGGTFHLTDASGAVFGSNSYTSDSSGLVTVAYLLPEASYTLSEDVAPVGYRALMDGVTLTASQDGEDVVASGAPEGVVTVIHDDPSGMTTVKVINDPLILRVVKIDAKDDTPLAGAHFALYPEVMGYNGQVRKDYYPVGGYEDIVSDTNGVLAGLDQTLPRGTYYLTETVAPDGHLLLSQDIRFRLNDRGKVELLSESNLVHLTLPQTDNSFTYTLTIENERVSQIMIQKKNRSGDLSLSGAEFELYRAADFDDVNQVPLMGTQAIVTGETDESGLLMLGDLEDGYYRLLETRAPLGYWDLEEALRIEVSGENVRILQDGVWRDCAVWYNGARVLTVFNDIAAEMPATGGIGTLWYYLGGGILLLTGTLALFGSGKRRRRKRRT